MGRKIRLAYGRGWHDLKLDGTRFEPTVFTPVNHEPLADPHRVFSDKAARPSGVSPLAEIARDHSGRTDVVIVTADHTRPVPDWLLVPWIVEALGVGDDQVTVLVGTGTHRASTEAEIERMLGREVMNRFRVVSHDCRDRDGLVRVGQSRCGGTCWLNRLYVEARVRVATGFIEPHFFAGFSGGAKAIVPGVAGLETIYHFHRSELIAHPLTDWGRLDDNPLAALSREMVGLCPPDFIVNVTLNLDKEITDVFVGDHVEAHRQGCRRAEAEATVRAERLFPVVVTTNSGYPLDQNFYQTAKGISAAARIVEPGGAIIAVSECSGGLPNGSEFEAILRKPVSSARLLQEILENTRTWYDQWEVQVILQVLAKARILLFSSLTEDQARAARVEPVASIEQALDDLQRGRGSSPLPLALLPMGPLTIPNPPA
ncbi:MAG: nickel-dependent lactate racemase [Proteobacteria bacterium]|nr:nickel-dependent lactate racemase [Pseudomonadota bacterium]